MQASRVAYRHFYRSGNRLLQQSETNDKRICNKLQEYQRRTHVYDKRHYVESEDFMAIQTARPWDHYMLRWTARRGRRMSQYFMWFCTLYLGMYTV